MWVFRCVFSKHFLLVSLEDNLFVERVATVLLPSERLLVCGVHRTEERDGIEMSVLELCTVVNVKCHVMSHLICEFGH